VTEIQPVKFVEDVISHYLRNGAGRSWRFLLIVASRGNTGKFLVLQLRCEVFVLYFDELFTIDRKKNYDESSIFDIRKQRHAHPRRGKAAWRDDPFLSVLKVVWHDTSIRNLL
jgi:hypothetical protein